VKRYGKYGRKVKLNSEMIWKIWKKSKLKSEKIRKTWKKSKLKSEKIWEIQKKGKLNSEQIWKTRKYLFPIFFHIFNTISQFPSAFSIFFHYSTGVSSVF
jgi:hypothetical protein